MRTQRRVWLMGWCLLVVMLGIRPALGQEQTQKPAEAVPTAEEIRLTRQVIDTQRQALVTKGMDLTPAEMQRFWPLYREYRLEMSKVGDRIVALITTYANNYQNLSESTADKLLTDFVRIEEQRARVKARYLPKFKQILLPRKVARFYQIENKLDVAVMADLAEAIPLAR